MLFQSKKPTSDLQVWTVINGVFPSNCYISGTAVPGECLIIDPGLDPAPIDAILAELQLIPRAVLCTHGHFDHVGSAAYFQRKYVCNVYMHSNDIKTLRSSNFLLMAFKIPARVEIPEIRAIESTDFFVKVSGTAVRFHPVPGHTPGSCLIELGNSIFSGDTIYSRGVGLSKLPGEQPEMLRQSILSIWDRFPDHTIIRPGHGDEASLGWIKQNNYRLLDFLQLSPATMFVAKAHYIT